MGILCHMLFPTDKWVYLKLKNDDEIFSVNQQVILCVCVIPKKEELDPMYIISIDFELPFESI